MSRLAGKTAFVTGAGSGIGRAVAFRLAEEEANVAAVDIRGAAAAETARSIEAAGGAALAVTCDVTRAHDVGEGIGATVRRFGGLDAVCNCAGIFLAEGGVVECDEDVWDRVLAVNLKSIFLTGKHALPHLRIAGGGAIVSIASVYGLAGLAGECAYDASKGGVINLTRQMAVEFADEGIRVNAVCPSDCDTPLIAALFGPDADPEEEKRKLAESIPMGRIAQPEDVAAAVAFLVSDDGRFVTGVTLPVDGGFLAQ
jgi:NAD(P)-dependent dehydrogenase (short-subunit alcohol dehydrogenase family)